MGLKSFACFPSSETSESQEDSCREDCELTKIEWPIEGERHAKPSSSRRKNAVRLGGG